MRRWMGLTAVVALAMLSSQGSLAAGDHDRDRSLKANLRGFEEAPTVFSTAHGEFEVKIARDEASFDYTLSYDDLETPVTQSHIHVGQLRVSGGIAIWLCQTATNPAPATVAATTPMCPGPNSGTVSGNVTAAKVIGPSAQGITAGEFEDVLRAMRSGLAYANVHSMRSPAGEIRGQIRGDDRDDHDHGHGDHDH